MHDRYNHKTKEPNTYKMKLDKDDLEEYEELCPECSGWGDVKWVFDNESYLICEICKGKGKIDWIDKIKGCKSES